VTCEPAITCRRRTLWAIDPGVAQRFAVLRTSAHAAAAATGGKHVAPAVFHCESGHIRARMRHELDATNMESCLACAYESVGYSRRAAAVPLWTGAACQKPDITRPAFALIVAPTEHEARKMS
jgi:hypothetical protein